MSRVNYNGIMIEEVYAMEGEKRKPGRPKSNLPTKVKRFSVRMSQPVYDRLREYAQARGLTVAEVINHGIERELQSDSE